jgi:hypothetical protein
LIRSRIEPKIFLAVVAAVLSIFLFSGCRVGLGVVAEIRLGVVYFASSSPETYGELYLDGSFIGRLEPLGVISRITTLDFPHQVDLRCGFCGEVHTWIFEPPFHAGETMELVVTH